MDVVDMADVALGVIIPADVVLDEVVAVDITLDEVVPGNLALDAGATSDPSQIDTTTLSKSNQNAVPPGSA